MGRWKGCSNGFSSSRVAKRQRIAEVASIGRISGQGLVELLRYVREHPELVDEPLSKDAVYRALDAIVKEVCVITKLRLEDGSPFDWVHGRPSCVIQYFLNTSVALSRFMKRRLELHQCTHTRPWSLVLYTDEITPGDGFAVDNPRKRWLWYFTFLEFGVYNLCKEELWFPFGTLRSHICKTMEGGLSEVAAYVLRCFLAVATTFRRRVCYSTLAA
jgi:hypothetical protein